MNACSAAIYNNSFKAICNTLDAKAPPKSTTIVLRVQIVQLKDTLISIAHPEVLTIEALQQLIQDTYKVPVEQQLLYHNRKRVEHAKLERTTLLQYGFKNDDLITVNLRLLGGGRLTRRKLVESPSEEWLNSPMDTGGLLRTLPTLADRLPLSPPTPAGSFTQADAASPSEKNTLYYGDLPKLELADDVDTDEDIPVPQEKKTKHARPYKQLYATPPHISNTILRMSTLNMNGILKQNGSDVGSIVAHIREFNLHVLVLIDHRLTNAQMGSCVQNLRTQLARDITHVTAPVTLYGKPTPNVPRRNISGYQQTVGGVAILAIGNMSSCLQPSAVCDPSGAGTYFCGAWRHIPDNPKIHIMAVYAFPKSIGHGFTVHDRLAQHLSSSKYAEKEPIQWFHAEMLRQHRGAIDVSTEKHCCRRTYGSRTLEHWNTKLLLLSYSMQMYVGTQNRELRKNLSTILSHTQGTTTHLG